MHLILEKIWSLKPPEFVAGLHGLVSSKLAIKSFQEMKEEQMHWEWKETLGDNALLFLEQQRGRLQGERGEMAKHPHSDVQDQPCSL